MGRGKDALREVEGRALVTTALGTGDAQLVALLPVVPGPPWSLNLCARTEHQTVGNNTSGIRTPDNPMHSITKMNLIS